MSNQRKNPNERQQSSQGLDEWGTGELIGSQDAAFLFIHGFGTCPLDLAPLAAAFYRRGYTCELLCLEGHCKDFDKLSSTKYESWCRQIRSAFGRLQKKYHQVYLVGFSIGGLLALDLAAEGSPAGVLSISTFLKPARPRLAAFVLRLEPLFRKGWMRFRLRTTTSESRQQLRWIGRLPLKLLGDILGQATRVQNRFGSINCPVLLFHSVDDKVASYDRVAATVKINQNVRSMIVTLFGLDHFLQFDVAPGAVCDLAIEFFGLGEDSKTMPDNATLLCERLKQRSEESRHWSDVLFRVVTGFYTLLGGLLYFSIRDVVEGSARAPFYIIAYSVLISLYIKLATLYFFYLNRVDSYIKYHIEPYIPGMGWVSFRTNQWASGRSSKQMTRLTSVTEGGFLFLISSLLLVYAFYKYPVLDPNQSNYLRVALFFGAAIWLIAARSLSLLTAYGKHHLFVPVVPNYTTVRIEEHLSRLYASIDPGAVRQPELIDHSSSVRASKKRREG